MPWTIESGITFGVGGGRVARLGSLLGRPLVAQKEERAIALKGPAARGAELMPPQRLVVARLGEVIVRVEDVVAQVLERRSAESIGARLRDDVDLRAGRAAVLG
jgi:hypothetical protein